METEGPQKNLMQYGHSTVITTAYKKKKKKTQLR